MIRILIFILIGFSIKTNSQAQQVLKQQTIDTLTLVRANFELEDDILYSIKNDSKVRAWTKYYIFKSFRCLADRKNDSALFYSNKAIEVFKEKESDFLPSAGLIHKAYYIKGLRNYFDGKYISAIKIFNKGLEYFEAFPKCYDGRTWESYIYTFLGRCHYDMGDLKLALFYEKKALLDWRMKYKYFGANAHLGVGDLYWYTGKKDSARYHMYQALRIFNDSEIKHSGENSLGSLKLNEMIAHSNLGFYHYKDGQLDSSLFYYKKVRQLYVSEEIDKVTPSKYPAKIFANANYAFLLMHQDSIQKSKQILERMVDSIQRFKEFSRENKRVYLNVIDCLREVHLKSKDFEKVTLLDEEVIKYLKAYNETNIAKQLQLLSVEFDVAGKEKRIKSLAYEKRATELEVRNYQVVVVSLLVFLLGSVLLFVFYRRTKMAQANYEKESLKQRLMLMQMNPHFIFNAFSAINGKIVSESANTTSYVTKLSTLFRQILNNSSGEYVSLSEELDLLTNYLNVQSDFLAKFNFDIRVAENLDQDITLIPPMLIQPLLENAIIHGLSGKGGEIMLSFEYANKKALKIIVLDNGIGLEKRKAAVNNHKSYSIQLIKERLMLLSKHYKQASGLYYESSDKGTAAYLTIPLILDV
jgi:tetratricopeptide (TPR) repeat protein/anti-sigma regulatory factor (Ser/Thr protein kinase)